MAKTLKARDLILFARPHHTYATGIFTLSSLARIKRPRWRPVELNDRHLPSHGKRGDCEQSISRMHNYCHQKSTVNLHDVLLINLSQQALD